MLLFALLKDYVSKGNNSWDLE